MAPREGDNKVQQPSSGGSIYPTYCEYGASFQLGQCLGSFPTAENVQPGHRWPVLHGLDLLCLSPQESSCRGGMSRPPQGSGEAVGHPRLANIHPLGAGRHLVRHAAPAEGRQQQPGQGEGRKGGMSSK